MLKRRQFIQQSAALSLGGLLTAKSFSSLLHTPLNQPAGLQLFTLFGVLDKDVPGGIKKIAEAGYKETEAAFSMKGGFYGMSAKEFASLLKDNGEELPVAHSNIQSSLASTSDVLAQFLQIQVIR